MYQSAQNSFGENKFHDLLQLPQVLYTLNNISQVANVKKVLLIKAALLHGSILENSLHHSEEINDTMKLFLIWDTEAS